MGLKDALWKWTAPKLGKELTTPHSAPHPAPI